METVGKIKDAGVTLRAVLIALPLICLNNWWITLIEVRWYALDGTCLPIFITPVFMLFLICLGNLGVRRLLPQWALRKGELLTIYIMIVMGATLASHDLIQNLFGAIGHPHFLNNESNHYDKVFQRFLPRDMFVTDKVALKGFYAGGTNPWVWSILRYWLAPLALWGSLILVLIAMMLCINILIRKQWTENEKLVFPLVQLPLAMTAENAGTKFYANKLMWLGFAIACFIGLLNGLHVLYPSLPGLAGVKAFNIGQFFTDRPWNAVNRLRDFNITMYPFTIGLAYFIPLDLSFSCWFFYVARKAWQVVGAAMGWDGAGTSGFPYWDAQSSGAWLALSTVIMMAAIPHLKSVWKQAFFLTGGTAEEVSESSLYRKSFYILGLGSAFLIWLSMWMGMPFYYAIIFYGLYFLISIGICRVRAELGTPHEIYFVNPQQIMVGLFGFNIIGVANMTVLQSMYWFNRCYRSHPMPNQLESMKLAEGTSIKMKPLIFVLMLSTVVGLLSAYWANLHICYQDGAQAGCLGFKWWVGAESFDKLVTLTKSQPGIDLVWIVHVILGAVIVIGLNLMRGAFVGWPFHPAGYALAISFAMDYFWFAFFVAWLIKLLLIRYGGMKLHNTFVPFFLGLVLGDFFIGSVWAIVGPLISTQAYKIFI